MSWSAPTGEPNRPNPGGEGSTVAAPAPPGPGDQRPPTGQPAPLTAPAQSLQPTRPTTAIQTLDPVDTTPKLAPINSKTGQPVRPWTIWASAGLLFAAAAPVTVGLLMAMWMMANPWLPAEGGWLDNDQFNQSTWLTGWFPTEEAEWRRVLFAILLTMATVLVAGVATVIGYYAFAGYSWTKFGALVALGVSLLTLLLNPVATISIALVALGAIPLWLAPTKRFFARWQAVRNPQVLYSEPVENVFYGPLPRYR